MLDEKTHWNPFKKIWEDQYFTVMKRVTNGFPGLLYFTNRLTDRVSIVSHVQAIVVLVVIVVVVVFLPHPLQFY